VATRNIAAVDLGASSGRVLLARFDGRNLDLQEVHRFPHRPVLLRGHRFWNILSLWEETLAGLRKARQMAGTLDSVVTCSIGAPVSSCCRSIRCSSSTRLSRSSGQ
jgi:rhamnulokinase